MKTTVAPTRSSKKPSQLEIFLTFLQIGAISFGGGVVAYLRNGLVRQKKWFDDVEFLELTSISNTLPGLNATNIAILAGDRLRGWLGATGALTAMCLPAFVFMTAAGMVYADSGARPLANAALRGVAAAATGTARRDVVSNREEIPARLLRCVLRASRDLGNQLLQGRRADHAACRRRCGNFYLSAARRA